MKTIQWVMLLLTQFAFVVQACSDGNEKDYLVTIKTKFGDMKAILYDATPKHKENFLKLAGEGYYDSLLFHRVINQFMIQTGDPESRGAAAGAYLGKGGPGYTIPAEFNPLIVHEKGALAAARDGDNINPQKASSGSQFYIVQGKVYPMETLRAPRVDYNQLFRYFNTYLRQPENKVLLDSVTQLQNEGNKMALQKLVLSKKAEVEKAYDLHLDLPPFSDLQVATYSTVGGTPHLDGAYTVFGKVIDGLDVIDKIAAVATDKNDRPLEDVIMTITVEEMPREKITQLYGYHYPSE